MTTRFLTRSSANSSVISRTIRRPFSKSYGQCSTCPEERLLVEGWYCFMTSMVTGSQPQAWSMSSSALTPNVLYSNSSATGSREVRATSPIVRKCMASSFLEMPPPTRQKSVSGRCVHKSSRYFISSSSAMRTPSLSGVAFFATMSMAILARYRFVPIPAVAVMPVLYSTSRTIVMAISCALMP